MDQRHQLPIALGIRRTLRSLRAFGVIWGLALLALTSRPLIAGELGYGGRLTHSSGEPVIGPVSMTLRFFSVPSGGDPVGPVFNYDRVDLIDGIFQISFDMSSPQIELVFGDGSRAVYVEVTAQGKTYPRQRWLATPLALQVPVDGSTLTFDSNGRLRVSSISQAQVSGLGTILAAKAETSAVTTALNAKADTTYVNTQLATKAASNATLSGDVSGSLNGAITVDRLKNIALPGTIGVADTNKYLQYNGTSFVMADVSSTSGGTVTNVTASGPLSVTDGSSAPALSITKASSTVNGYLSAADFETFNGKQAKIDGTTALATASLTTGEVRVGELDANGTNYVGFKAPDSLTTDRIWTLPDADGTNGQVLKTNGTGILAWTDPGSGGTVTSVSLTAPSAGITVSGGPITSSGSITLGLANDLGALESLSTTGGAERTGDGTWATYTLTPAGKALLDDANAEAQRTTLGLSSLATATSVSGGAAGIISPGTITNDDISTFAGIAQSKIAGLATALSDKANTSTVNAALDTKASTTYVDTQLANKAASNAILSGDVSGSLNGAITVDRLKNYDLPASMGPGDASKYLQFNGSSFVLAPVSGGTVTNVTATGPLSVTDGSSTPALSITKASSTVNGYLSAADFGTFNSKQDPITASTSLATATLSTDEVRFRDLPEGGSEYVGFKAPATVTSSLIWTLPATDGGSNQVLSTNGSGILSWVSPGGSGTVTSVGLTATGSGISVSGGPITGSGSISVSLDADLGAIADLGSTGGVERTGDGTWATYTLTTAGKALLDDVDPAAQRTTLQLSSLATATSISGGAAGSIAPGTITDEDISTFAGIAQSKISGLTTALDGKQNFIPEGTGTQYYRGDKTWQTLSTTAVAEGSKLFYTEGRARSALSVSGAPLSYDTGTGVISLSAATASTPGYLTATDFGTFNSKQDPITASTTLATGAITTALQSGLMVQPYGSTTGTTGEVRFGDLPAGGSYYVGFRAPDTIAANRIWTLPAADGTNNQVLSTNGSGILSWANPGNSGTVTSVSLTAPSAGITVSGGPITSAGSITLTLANDLGALESLSTTGGAERTGDGTWGTYTLTQAGKDLLDDANAAAQRTTLQLSSLATATAVSGGSGGTITDNTITDADIASGAAISDGKLASITTAGKISGSAITAGTISGSATFGGSGGVNTSGAIITTGAMTATGAITGSGHITANATTEVRFADSDSTHYVGFKAPATVAVNRIWTLPAADGTGGQVLSTDGSGTLAWATASGGGGSTYGTTGGAGSHPASGCPTGYIAVPGDSAYVTTDFCVMKYEAKFGPKGAMSQSAGLPARGLIDQNRAISACRNLGPGYALINNAEWMTVATNIANVGSNWSNGAVGNSSLNRGHSNGTTALAAAADSAPCTGTGQTCSDTVWHVNRRTHTLSNGQVIWDLAGNVWEWVDYLNWEDKPSTSASWIEYTSVAGSTSMPKTELIPTGKAWWVSGWTGASNGIGQYVGGATQTGGALLRGGNWGSGTYAGVFAAILDFGPTSANSLFGFRCVFRPSSL